jgi:hypothetical protein
VKDLRRAGAKLDESGFDHPLYTPVSGRSGSHQRNRGRVR